MANVSNDVNKFAITAGIIVLLANIGIAFGEII